MLELLAGKKREGESLTHGRKKVIIRENKTKKGIVMHPGPVNRGVEISSEVADGNRSVILQQVSNGIAVRMAILSLSMQP